MKYGFTGTQQGCTPQQLASLREFLSTHTVTEFHHGGCVGADAQAHEIARLLGCPIYVYPSNIEQKRAACPGAAVTYPPKPPLKRNPDIVNATDRMIACPKGEDEELHSGTWTTVRYARKKRKVIVFVYPNGRLCVELYPPQAHDPASDF